MRVVKKVTKSVFYLMAHNTLLRFMFRSCTT